jgi:hypothetical protein
MKQLVVSDEDIERLKEWTWTFTEPVMLVYKNSLQPMGGGARNGDTPNAKGPPFVCGIEGCTYDHEQEQYLKLHQSKTHGVRGVNWRRKHKKENGTRGGR